MAEEKLNRRQFLSGFAAAAAALPGLTIMASTGETQPDTSSRKDGPRIGLALGAGGAKGLAHIVILETLDEMGVRPHIISGSSMGAVIGALYASGLSGKAIRQFIGNLVVTKNESWPEALFRKDLVKWIDFIAPEIGSGGLIDGEDFIRYIHKAIRRTDFSDLRIPLKVVAADFWKREQVVIESGALLPALKASMALPGLFIPVQMGDRVLVDGGTVNPVPYDLLIDDCDITIAIDVIGMSTEKTDTVPSFFDAVFSSVHIMQQAILTEKMKRHPPDIYIKPPIKDIRVLDFMDAGQVYQQTAPARDQLKQELGKLIT